MTMAARARSVAATRMNATSSRSHSVFTLRLTGREQGGGNSSGGTGKVLHGVLHLVDLAGSERLDRSGAAGDEARLRETQAINKSLSSVADVFAALGSRAKHVPYRNSTLTYLLQDCLSGDGKAAMIASVSPTAASAHETLCSLRFAAQVNGVELGKGVRHVTVGRTSTPGK
ncbi:unnamed protein product, partial [Phaeothamnion confervicola]